MKEYLGSLKKRKRLMDIGEIVFSPLLFTSLLFTAICKASSDSHLAFLHFFFLDGFDSYLLYNVEPPSIVHQVLYPSDLIP